MPILCKYNKPYLTEYMRFELFLTILDITGIHFHIRKVGTFDIALTYVRGPVNAIRKLAYLNFTIVSAWDAEAYITSPRHRKILTLE